MVEDVKLKPCPFCDCEPVLEKLAVTYQVKCVNNLCERSPRTRAWNYPETAINEWNERALKQEAKSW